MSGPLNDFAASKEKDSQLFKVLVIGDYAVGTFSELYISFFLTFSALIGKVLFGCFIVPAHSPRFRRR